MRADPMLSQTTQMIPQTMTLGGALAPTELPATALDLLAEGRRVTLAQQRIRDQWVLFLNGILSRSLGTPGRDLPEVDTLSTSSIAWCARTVRGDDMRATTFRIHNWRLRADSFSIAHPLSAVWEADAEAVIRGWPAKHRCTLVGHVFPASLDNPNPDAAAILALALAA